jgi:NitT/TauT family transport system substrate-binding protein
MKFQLHSWGQGMVAAVAIALLAACSPATTESADPVAEAPTADTETAATSGVEDTGDTEELTPVRFTLSWLLQGLDAPFTVAMERGYFEAEGLDVSFERGFGSADSITKIAAGQYDIGEGDIYAMIEFNEKNPDTPLVAVAIKFNRSPLAVVSLGETGITSPDMLAGKNLGSPAGDAARRLFPVFAEVTGVDESTVTWSNVEPQLRETMLAQGEFDAISCFATSCLPSLDKLGHPVDDLNVFYYNDHGLNLYGNALIVRWDFLEENPEVVGAFVRAYLAGLKDTLTDPDAAFATVSAYADGGVFDDKVERQRLDLALEILYTSPETEANGIGGIDPARLEETITQAVQGFGLSNTPPVEDVFDDQFLPPQSERML